MFEEKTDLLPFEEAKLYGHNAVHALAAYLGALRGVRYIADLQAYPEIVAFLKTAFINEAGAALMQKYDGLDPVFTEAGFRYYATDLLERMMSPYLRDTVQRVSRDPERKLGWNDRLVGTMRLVLHQGIKPVRFALGAAAAVNMLDKNILKDEETLNTTLSKLWADASPDPSEKEVILSFIIEAGDLLQRWQNAGFSNLVGLVRKQI
jgi:mannitol-1-phosphate 5-dehydrogenase